MFTVIFGSILRCIAIPIVAFLLLQNSFLGPQGSFLGVTIALTFSNVISIIFQLIRVLPNLVLLKGRNLLMLSIRIIIEIASILGFWFFYASNFGGY